MSDKSTPTLINETVESEDRISSEHRYYYYGSVSRISVAMDVTSDGDVFVAIAACNPRDTFIRRRSKKRPNLRNARDILDGRLNKMLSTINGDNELRNRFVIRFSNIYLGDKSRRDVWFPFLDSLREFLSKHYLDTFDYDDVSWTEMTKERNVDTILKYVDGFSESFDPNIEEKDMDYIMESTLEVVGAAV